MVGVSLFAWRLWSLDRQTMIYDGGFGPHHISSFGVQVFSQEPKGISLNSGKAGDQWSSSQAVCDQDPLDTEDWDVLPWLAVSKCVVTHHSREEVMLSMTPQEEDNRKFCICTPPGLCLG